MQRRTLIYIAALAAAALVVVASVGMGALPIGQRSSGTTSECPGCVQSETVVDLLMPAIGSGVNATNPNRTLNFSAGSTRTLEVDVYPTASLSVSFEFSSFSASSSAQGPAPSASFQPSSVSVGANQKGITYMTVTVPQGAQPGVYDSVVSAVNAANSTQVWGLYFEIQVS